MKQSIGFTAFRNVVYFGCLVFAYGIAGSLELGRLSLSEAFSYFGITVFVCFGINFLRFFYLLCRALILRRKKEYGTRQKMSRSAPILSYRI